MNTKEQVLELLNALSQRQVVTVPAVVWVVTWLWQSFRTASGLRGPKAGLLFAGALLVAEVLSKIVLGFLSVLLHHNGL